VQDKKRRERGKLQREGGKRDGGREPSVEGPILSFNGLSAWRKEREETARRFSLKKRGGNRRNLRPRLEGKKGEGETGLRKKKKHNRAHLFFISSPAATERQGGKKKDRYY